MDRNLTYWHVHIAMPNYDGAGCMTIGTKGAEDNEATRAEALSLGKRAIALSKHFTPEQRANATLSKFELTPEHPMALELAASLGVTALITDANLALEEAQTSTAQIDKPVLALPPSPQIH